MRMGPSVNGIFACRAVLHVGPIVQIWGILQNLLHFFRESEFLQYTMYVAGAEQGKRHPDIQGRQLLVQLKLSSKYTSSTSLILRRVTHFDIFESKPTKWLCIQWRLRSAWASAQSDQRQHQIRPTKWLCIQWRLRSAWASAQSDQRQHQISLGICPVWSESSLSAWRKLGSLATHWAHSENSEQTGWMPRPICLRWVHSHFVGFVMGWLISGLSLGGDLEERVSISWLTSLLWAEGQVKMYRTYKEIQNSDQNFSLKSWKCIHVNPSWWTWGRFGSHFREIEVCFRETIRPHF